MLRSTCVDATLANVFHTNARSKLQLEIGGVLIKLHWLNISGRTTHGTSWPSADTAGTNHSWPGINNIPDLVLMSCRHARSKDQTKAPSLTAQLRPPSHRLPEHRAGVKRMQPLPSRVHGARQKRARRPEETGKLKVWIRLFRLSPSQSYFADWSCYVGSFAPGQGLRTCYERSRAPATRHHQSPPCFGVATFDHASRSLERNRTYIFFGRRKKHAHHLAERLLDWCRHGGW